MKSTCSEGSRLVRVDGYDPGPTGPVHVHVQSGVTCRGKVSLVSLVLLQLHPVLVNARRCFPSFIHVP